MSRTWRRAAPRNAPAIRVVRGVDDISRIDYFDEQHQPTGTGMLLIGQKRIRDGNTIRGCNGDSCSWCAANRRHVDIARRQVADAELREFFS